jgi:DNA-binding IclR family transcriptional regulator
MGGVQLRVAHPAGWPGGRPSLPGDEAALERILGVLDLFTADRRALGFAEIAGAAGLSDRAAEPLLDALCRHGLLAHDPARDRYTAGIRTLELAYGFRAETGLIEAARPVLAAIRDRLDETSMLAVRWGDHRVNIAQMTSARPLRQEIPEGKRKPLYIGAGGKILLAGLDDDAVADYLGRVPLEKHSPTTTTDRAELLACIAAIRRSGYAETFSERNSGGASFGAAVRSAGGAIVAALVVSVPLCRYGRDLRARVRQLLLDGAEETALRLAAGQG